MGGGIILLGIMAILIPEGYMVIALHGIIQLFSNTTRTWIFRKHIKKQLIKQFSLGSFLGLLLSSGLIYLLITLFEVKSANQIKVDFLKPLIGFFILWYLYLKPYKKEGGLHPLKLGLFSTYSSWARIFYCQGWPRKVF